MNTERQLATQKEFADLLGKDKSYITRLKQQGRLVLVDTPHGQRVDVQASKARIAATEGGREDVAARHAAKGQEPVRPSESRVDAQTRKEMAQADIAEMERDQLRGSLIERELVDQALADVVAFARQGFENFPHRVAAQLVGKDFDQINATLREAVIEIMGDMHKEAGKRLAELTKEGM